MSLNINGIRSGISKGFLDYLNSCNPDMVCLQEIKASEDQIPIIEIETLGYHTFWFSAQKKGYSGTAILSKKTPDNIVKGMNISQYDDEGRFLRIDIGKLSFICVYHPSGSSGEVRQAFKMKWFEDFAKFISSLQIERPKLVISGDFNVCHKEIDIHDPIRNKTVSGFLPEERAWMDRFLNNGFIDTFRFVNQEPNQYSWWSFRAGARAKNLGWRIDYNIVSENLKNNIIHASIDNSVFFSDHCPVIVELDVSL